MKNVLFLALLAFGAVSCTQEAGVEETTVDTTSVVAPVEDTIPAPGHVEAEADVVTEEVAQ